MTNLEVFDERIEEIDAYIKLLEQLSDPQTKIILENKNLKSLESKELNTLKATIFLLLYNLVESTVSSLVTDLSLEIERQETTYKDLNPTIQKLWIDQVFAEGKKGSQKSNFVIIDEMIQNSQKQNTIQNLFPQYIMTQVHGNICEQQLKTIANLFGFNEQHPQKKHRSSKILTQVRDRRNELAHGNVSFQAIGQNLVPSDIKALRDDVVTSLRGFIQNVDEYIESKSFLVTSSTM